MFKKIIFIFVSIAMIGLVYYLFFEKKNSEQTSQLPANQEEPSSTDEVPIIDKIHSLSKKGMILEVPFTAGETGYEEVAKIFGTPENLDETSVGDYAVYPEKRVTIGYKKSIAFDLRSYAKELEKIHYKEVLDQLGEPTDIKYYQDAKYDQIILTYQISDEYQLKWILDEPTEKKPNPTVHHISVVATKPSKQLTILELVDRMSLDEKIGQMIFAGVEGTKSNGDADRLVREYKVGGIILNGENITTPSQTVAYINDLKARNSINKVPLFLGIDQEGGRITKLPGELQNIPTNLEIGKMNDPAFSFELGTVLGKLVKAYGFNINFAPVLDVNSNPDNPVIGDRSFSANPEIVSELGIQTMKGIQSENIIASVKHFPGHGDTSVDSHLELPTVNKSRTQLEELELIPFKRAIDEGAEMLMVAHILLPKLDDYPSSMSKVIMTDFLREGLGYDGVIITDDMTMEAIEGNFDMGDAAIRSIKAGSDIVMVAHDYDKMFQVIEKLKNAVEQGEISEERIDESVTRILRLKEKYGVEDTRIGKVNVDTLNQMIGTVLTNS